MEATQLRSASNETTRHHLFHRGVRAPGHTGAEEQAGDVVAAIELHGQPQNFLYGEGRARDRVVCTVGARGTAVEAGAGQQDLEERNSPTIVGPTVADPAGRRG